MATLGQTYLTLADKMKRSDPDNKIAAIIEILSETNEILQDAIVLEGNLPTGHRTTVRTGLPTSTWRKLNYGVQPSKSTTKQVDDSCGMLEAYSEVDKALADLNGNSAAFRMSEDVAFMESMNQTMASTMFYGDTDVYPERFMGLAPRYDSISTDPTKAGYNIIDAGGTGSDNTSVWFMKWGPNTVFLTYPKGSKAGFQHTDLGEDTLIDDNGGKYQGYRSHYKWDVGLVLRDWRAVARVANIDVSNLNAGSVAIDDFMIDAYYKVKKRPGKAAIYCTESVMIALHKIAKDKANVNLTISTFEGREIVSFLGMPIRECEQLLETEAQVT